MYAYAKFSGFLKDFYDPQRPVRLVSGHCTEQTVTAKHSRGIYDEPTPTANQPARGFWCARFWWLFVQPASSSSSSSLASRKNGYHRSDTRLLGRLVSAPLVAIKCCKNDATHIIQGVIVRNYNRKNLVLPPPHNVPCTGTIRKHKMHFSVILLYPEAPGWVIIRCRDFNCLSRVKCDHFGGKFRCKSGK